MYSNVKSTVIRRYFLLNGQVWDLIFELCKTCIKLSLLTLITIDIEPPNSSLKVDGGVQEAGEKYHSTEWRKTKAITDLLPLKVSQIKKRKYRLYRDFDQSCCTSWTVITLIKHLPQTTTVQWKFSNSNQAQKTYQALDFITCWNGMYG